MEDIRDLINKINSGELYDAKELLNNLTKDRIEDYKEEIIKKVDIFDEE